MDYIHGNKHEINLNPMHINWITTRIDTSYTGRQRHRNHDISDGHYKNNIKLIWNY